jgi:signal transduction histidine kinase
VSNSDGYLQISIEDKGKGFDVEAAEAADKRRFGLFGVHEGLCQFGGNMAIDSEPGKGTRVTVDGRG